MLICLFTFSFGITCRSIQSFAVVYCEISSLGWYLSIRTVMRALRRLCIDRVRTGHGKPGKSWNLLFQFPGLESHGI